MDSKKNSIAQSSFDLEHLREAKTLSELEASIDSLDQLSYRLSTLGEVHRILSRSLDISVTAKELVSFLVPRVAEVASFSVRAGDGKFANIAVRHVDPAKDAIVKQILDLPPRKPLANAPGGLAFFSGKAEIVRNLNPDEFKGLIDLMELPPNIAESLQKAISRSYLAVPMVLESGEVMGMIFLGSPTPFDLKQSDVDLSLVKEVASLSAHAIRNSELYRSAKTETEQMQLEREVRVQFLRKQVHDIKTPLTAITLAVEMMSRVGSNSKKLEELKVRVQENVQRISKMLTDSLSWQPGSAEGMSSGSAA